MKFSTMFQSKQKSQVVALPIDSVSTSFCSCCGVDVAQFSHEFWCRFSMN
ncbi:hypothetical protein MUCCIDRAFT_109372 [Mucor lusitanicus CBS 277.49]|uniref:Uncharacterized protein n=1 Tax=Mucor lusitanicus CBS 277.49 TaxID=747725 RepID=A0A168MXQ7_MUCCL|nr:hypothetical protein MUCCIDRAFT_109372 [Mucor lusitanicus CBS 277.49]